LKRQLRVDYGKWSNTVINIRYLHYTSLESDKPLWVKAEFMVFDSLDN